MRSLTAPTATLPIAMAKTLISSIVKPVTVERMWFGVRPWISASAGP